MRFPLWTRAHLSLGRNLFLLGLLSAPLAAYCLVFGFVLYELSPSNATISGIVADVDPRSSHVGHFRAVTQLLVFTAPTLGALCFGVLIVRLLQRAHLLRRGVLNERRGSRSRHPSQLQYQQMLQQQPIACLRTPPPICNGNVRRESEQCGRPPRRELLASVVAAALSAIRCALFAPTLLLWLAAQVSLHFQSILL